MRPNSSMAARIAEGLLRRLERDGWVWVKVRRASSRPSKDWLGVVGEEWSGDLGDGMGLVGAHVIFFDFFVESRVPWNGWVVWNGRQDSMIVTGGTGRVL